MIVSASYRTDIPAFYARWFLRRLKAGYCIVANPYGGGSLQGVATRRERSTASCSGPAICGPLLPHLDAVRQVAPFVVQFTVTGYPRALETSVIAPDEAVAQLRELRRRFGPARRGLALRPGRLRRRPRRRRRMLAGFATLARALAGTVDEVVLSVVHPYRKTRRNLDRAAPRHGFAWHDPPPDEKRDLLRRLAAIAREHGMAPTLCSQPDLLAPGLGEARCIDAERLARCRRNARSPRARAATARAAAAPSRATSAPTTPARMAASIAMQSPTATAPSRISATTTRKAPTLSYRPRGAGCGGPRRHGEIRRLGAYQWRRWPHPPWRCPPQGIPTQWRCPPQYRG